MELVKHETCVEYVARRLSEGWRIIDQKGFLAVLESPEGIIRPVDLRNDIETLRPNAPGAETSINFQEPDSTYHWDKVDEATSDEGDTCVYTSSGTYQRDLYSLPASSGSGTISKITVFFRCSVDHPANEKPKAAIKSNTTVTDGDAKTLGAAVTWETLSQEWAVNPAPPGTNAWEWADIDALQIGVSLNGYFPETSHCTQVYVEVDYTPPAGWTGKISGVTNPAKVMGADVANIAKVKGVA